MRTPPRTATPATPATAHLHRGFRFETLRCAPATGFRPEPVDLRVLATPQEAIRAVRIQIRAGHVLGLTPREQARALYWSDRGGWVQALAALHRGEPCGFVLMLRKGRHIEWNVRPLTYVSLAAGHESPPAGARSPSPVSRPTGSSSSPP